VRSVSVIERVVKLAEKKELHCAVIDDDKEFLLLMESFLAKLGIHITCTDDGRDILHKHQDSPFDVLFVGWDCKKMSGKNFLDKLAKMENLPSIIIVFNEGNFSLQTKVEIKCFLFKPFGAERIIRCLNKALGESHGHC